MPINILSSCSETKSFEQAPGSPWSSTGCFISRHPVMTGAVFFLFFWVYRSQYYSGDGDQLSRMIESREPAVWLVQTELASQAVFKLVYQLLFPWGWDGLSVMNLVSSAAGAISVYVLLKFSLFFVSADPLWTLLLFFSSGLALFCNGHTEYYTLFLMTLFYYGYAGVGYLRGRFSMLHASLAFSAALWMHLGILFALPSLLILPWLKGQPRDFGPLMRGQIPTLIAYIVKRFDSLLKITVLGLSPQSNFVPLVLEPDGAQFYGMFEWGHLADILYAWIMRSWIFWPAIFWSIAAFGFSSLRQPARLFLLAYTLCFTVFTLVWHPNLGMGQDWDLFAIEAAPCLLLLLTYLPVFLDSSFRWTALAVAASASMLIVYSSYLAEARFYQRGYGGVELKPSKAVVNNFTLNGHKKDLTIPAIREGVYIAKFINNDESRVHDFCIAVVPGQTTEISLAIGPNQGRGSIVPKSAASPDGGAESISPNDNTP
ncbi:MAG: hypothetical protein AB1656_22645 [Candidatus Omnitrophota bacterium]